MDKKNILILSIFTLLTSIGWVAFEVIHAVTDSTIPKNVEEQLAPVIPTFDKTVIDSVKTRVQVEILQNNSFPAASEVNSPKIASGSSETATESGTQGSL